MVEVFREVRRVLRKDGVLFLNLGDSYNSAGPSNHGKSGVVHRGTPAEKWSQPNKAVDSGLKPKDLCGIPWRVALALQADGWYLRSDIIWAKPNPMPESCTDRPTKAHEYIFLLTKSAHYFYDNEAVREEPYKFYGDKPNNYEGKNFNWTKEKSGIRTKQKWSNPSGRNLRTVWEIATHPFPGSHFATFPPELVRRCVAAGTSERGCCPNCGAARKRVVKKSGGTTGKDWNTYDRGEADLSIGATKSNATTGGTYHRESIGWTPTCTCNAGEPIPCTVLDPFSGAGTTALVAAKLGRDAIGIELNPDYVEMSRKRIAGELGMLAEVKVKKFLPLNRPQSYPLNPEMAPPCGLEPQTHGLGSLAANGITVRINED